MESSRRGPRLQQREVLPVVELLLLCLRLVEFVEVAVWVWVVLATGLQSGRVDDSVIIIPGNSIHQQAVRDGVPGVAFVARRRLLLPVGFDASQHLMECVSHSIVPTRILKMAREDV